MSDRDQINRRDFIVTTAGVAGSASALAGATVAPAQAQTSPPPGFVDQPPFAKNWAKPLREVVQVDLSTAAPELARTYFAEFMRLYEHYRARALWNLAQGKGAKPRTKGRSKKSAAVAVADTFTLKRSRDAWAKGAYKPGTAEFRARTQLAGG